MIICPVVTANILGTSIILVYKYFCLFYYIWQIASATIQLSNKMFIYSSTFNHNCNQFAKVISYQMSIKAVTVYLSVSVTIHRTSHQVAGISHQQELFRITLSDWVIISDGHLKVNKLWFILKSCQTKKKYVGSIFIRLNHCTCLNEQILDLFRRSLISNCVLRV